MEPSIDSLRSRFASRRDASSGGIPTVRDQRRADIARDCERPPAEHERGEVLLSASAEARFGWNKWGSLSVLYRRGNESAQRVRGSCSAA
jgi:hypothetical protein